MWSPATSSGGVAGGRRTADSGGLRSSSWGAVKVPEVGEVEEPEWTEPGHFPDRGPCHQHIHTELWTFMLSVTAVTSFCFPSGKNHCTFPPQGREGGRGASTNLSNRHHRRLLGVWGRGDEGMCLLTVSDPVEESIAGVWVLVAFNVFIFIVNTRYLCNRGGMSE